MQPVLGQVVRHDGCQCVSILIRPSGRMQPPASRTYDPAIALSFQFSSGLLAGCNSAPPAGLIPFFDMGCFNPHPAFWPDATRTGSGTSLAYEARSFNPHPAFWPDATRAIVPDSREAASRFQSSSGLLAGCNGGKGLHAYGAMVSLVSILIRPSGRMQRFSVSLYRCAVDAACFNPHPAFWPDATDWKTGVSPLVT